MTVRHFVLSEIVEKGKCCKEFVCEKYNINNQRLMLLVDNSSYDLALYDDCFYLYSLNIKNVRECVEEMGR